MAMKNKTRRALVLSVLSLILCCSMLVGTTFAWFTDSVTSGNNEIKSGNLDVSLWHKRWNGSGYATDWLPVENDTNLFANIEGKPILWEPEAEAQERFLIKNEGSLALKYQFKLNFANATETEGGNTLADVLDVQVAAWNTNSAINDTIVNGLNGVPLKDCVFESSLLPGESLDFEVVVKWNQTELDNEYNIPGGMKIDMGIELVATQFPYEKDVEDDQYDAAAQYPEVVAPPLMNAAEVQDALNNGGNFVLGADIDLGEALTVPAGVASTIDLKGYDLIAPNAEGKAALRVKGEVTLLNTGDAAAITVEGDNTSGNYPAINVSDGGVLNFASGEIAVVGGQSASAIQAFGGEVNFDAGKITVGGNGGHAYGIAAIHGAVINMNGGEIVVTNTSNTSYAINAVMGTSTVNLNNGKISMPNGTATQVAVAFSGESAGSTLNIANGFVFDINAAAEYKAIEGQALTVNDNR